MKKGVIYRSELEAFIKQDKTTGVNKKEITPRPQYHLSGDKCKLGLLPQHVKFLSLDGRYKANQNFCHSELVSESSKNSCEPVCVAVLESNQIDRCRNKFGMTEEFPSPGGRGLGVRGVPARDNRTATETIPSLFVTLAEPTLAS
ncbi:hypothetical protein IJ579_02150 [bacterium]|nr:hypothetical protein [bacterium]